MLDHHIDFVIFFLRLREDVDVSLLTLTGLLSGSDANLVAHLSSVIVELASKLERRTKPDPVPLHALQDDLCITDDPELLH